MTKRLIVIGGDAAGMAAASTAKKRLGDALDVLVFERGHWTSYSACGIPYWVSGDVDGPDALVARSPQDHRANGIDVRMGAEVVAIDRAARVVEVSGADGTTSRHAYDDLVIATGAEPIRPPLPGIDAEGIYGVQTLDDGVEILDGLGRDPKRAIIVGSGYIGVEMAEACVKRGLETTVVDQAPTPIGLLDAELGAQVHVAMTGMGMDVRMSTPVREFAVADGRVCGVVVDDGVIDADIVLLGIGVRARSELAESAGLALGETGAIRVDRHQRVDAEAGIWAAGDCVESYDRLRKSYVHVPLGTHANKQGWIVGRNVMADPGEELVRFPGIVGTAVTKVCDLEIGISGLGESDARDAGFDPVAVTIETTTRAGYFPGAQPMTVKLVADRDSRRVLGSQIVGREGSALRIDTVAMALWSGLTVDELMLTDLAYAPPFSPVWDPVQVAARALASKLGY